MATRLSALCWLQMGLKRITEAPTEFSFKPEETEKLDTLLVQIEDLHMFEEYAADEIHKGPNTMLHITRDIVASSVNSQESAALLHQVHGLISGHFVDAQLYVWLGKAFVELGIDEMIEPDLKIAIDDARRRELGQGKEFAAWPLDYSDTFCPNAAIRKEKDRRSGRKEFDYSDQYESD